MDKIVYSFIVPHKNSLDLLQRCLESIPDRNDIQVIVVDDNSAEDKKPRLGRKGVDVVYIDAEHTNGAGHARNEGLKKAKGEWILFADADDYYNKGFLEVLDHYRDRKEDVVYFGFDILDSESGAKVDIFKKATTAYKNISNGADTPDEIRFWMTTPWNKMINRTCIL